MSSMKRKWNVVTIETKLETVVKLVTRISVSFLAVRYNIGTGQTQLSQMRFSEISIIRKKILSPKFFAIFRKILYDTRNFG